MANSMTILAAFVTFLVAALPGTSAVLLQERALTQPTRSLETIYKSAQRSFANGDYRLAFDEADELCDRSASDSRFYFLKGEIAFASGKVPDSILAFDRCIELEPQLEPQLWQRGLALYYAERFEEGVKQFESHQTVNSQDVENAVWHLLCAAQVWDVAQARTRLIPIQNDDRVPMSQVYEMFAGRLKPDDVFAAANLSTPRVPEGSTSQDLQRYYAHLYVGLYWEMLDQPEKSLAEMKAAEALNPLGKNNFMGRVAPVHIALRESSLNPKSPSSRPPPPVTRIK